MIVNSLVQHKMQRKIRRTVLPFYLIYFIWMKITFQILKWTIVKLWCYSFTLQQRTFNWTHQINFIWFYLHFISSMLLLLHKLNKHSLHLGDKTKVQRSKLLTYQFIYFINIKRIHSYYMERCNGNFASLT